MDDIIELPRGIDLHVHFREPGFTHKETMTTGMNAAKAGGIYDVVDMPNTMPVSDSYDALLKKRLMANRFPGLHLAGGITSRSVNNNELELMADISGIFKVYLANSTGDLGITLGEFEKALSIFEGIDKHLIMVHAEDPILIRKRDGLLSEREARPIAAEASSIGNVLRLAKDYPATNIHITHVSSLQGAKLLVKQDKVTWDVLAKHYSFSEEMVKKRGAFGIMNPPLRSEENRVGLYHMLIAGDIPLITSDHAPHTREEKRTSVAGAPGVQELYHSIIDLYLRGEMTYNILKQVISDNPRELLGKAGIFTEPGMIEVDTTATTLFDKNSIKSKCGWSLWEDIELRGKIIPIQN